MSPLRNQRHERFCLALAEGHSIAESYAAAGYSKNRGNASRLKANESIVTRLAELQGAAAKSSLASLLSELEDARQQATSLKQLSACVRAVEAKARISGLLVEKVEVKTLEEKFEDCKSPQDIVRRSFVECQRDGYGLEEKDWEEYRRLMLGWWEALDNFLAAAKAKPVQPIMSAEARDRHERKRLGLAPRSPGNGSRQ